MASNLSQFTHHWQVWQKKKYSGPCFKVCLKCAKQGKDILFVCNMKLQCQHLEALLKHEVNNYNGQVKRNTL